MKRVDEHLFNQVKGEMNRPFPNLEAIARLCDISMKTLLQIRGSEDFSEYQQQNKAQHPDVQFSLRDHVLELHRLAFRQDNTGLDQVLKQDGYYIGTKNGTRYEIHDVRVA